MKKKSLVKWLIITGVVLALLIGGGIAAVYLVFPPEKVVALVLPQVEKATGRKITLEKAGFSFFPRLGISLSGLSIRNTDRKGFSALPFLTMENFTACVSVASVFKGSPEVTRIVFKKPCIRIEVDEEGKFNFDDLGLKDTSQRLNPGVMALPIPLTIEKIIIEGGTLVYDDRKMGILATVGTVDEEAQVSMDRDLQNVASDGTLHLSNIAVKTKDFEAPLSGLTVTATHDIGADLPAGTISVKAINVSCGKLAGVITGTVKDALTKSPALDFRLSAPPINVQDLLGMLPASLAPFAPKLSASGILETEARLQGILTPGRQPLLTGSAKLHEVTIHYADLPQSINHLNAAIEFTDKSVTVDSLTMRFGTSPIEIKAVVTDLQKRLLDATVKAEIDLDEAKDIVKLPPGATIGGKVAADIRVDGVIDPDDPGKLFCIGTIDFRQVRLLMPPLARPAVINGGIVLAKESAAARFTVAVDQSSLAADATIAHYLGLAAPPGATKVKRPIIDCKITASLLDLDKMLSLPPPQAGKSSTPAQPDLLLPMPLPNADLHATMSAKQIVYKGFAMNAAVSKMTVVNNIADVSFSSGFSSGAIDNALHADLRTPKTIAFSDKFAVKNVELNDLMVRFGDLVQPVTPLNKQLAQINKGLFGRVSVQGALQGAGGTPESITSSVSGTMTMHMTDGKLENTPVQKVALGAFTTFLKTDRLGSINPITFKELSASVRIANSRAFIDNLLILSDLGDWKAVGSVGFDADMDMAVSTRLSKMVSDRILAVEDMARGAAKNLLQGTQLAAAAGLLDNLSLIPHDNEGRVSLKFALSGPVDRPRVGSLAFGDVGRGKAAAAPATPVQGAKEAIKENAEKAKQNAQEEIKKAGEQIKNKLRGLFQ